LKHIRKIGIIGGGVMGAALASGVIGAGLVPSSAITVADVSEACRRQLCDKSGVNVTPDNRTAVDGADVIILAVKPFIMDAVLKDIGPQLVPSQTVISIAAGVEIRDIEGSLIGPIPVIRVMPNTPALVGAAASAYALGSFAGAVDASRAEAVFNAVGRVAEVPERLLNAVTGLSGSGPAYVFLVIEALADGGVRMGLPRDVAIQLAAQTTFGAAKMVLESGRHPAELKNMVTTPGGTTAAGLFALEEGAVRAAFQKAVQAAADKAREIKN
jgi:pyrroline-5-carboxylate reductase